MQTLLVPTEGLEHDLKRAKRDALKGVEIVWFHNEVALRVLVYDPVCDLYDVWSYLSIAAAIGEELPSSTCYLHNIAYYRLDPFGLASFSENDANKAPLVYEILTTSPASERGLLRELAIIRGMLRENKLPVLLEATAKDQPGMLLNSQGLLVYVNTAACEMWGLCADNVLGKHISEFDPNWGDLDWEWGEHFVRLCQLGSAQKKTKQRTPNGIVKGTMSAHVKTHRGEKFALCIFDADDLIDAVC